MGLISAWDELCELTGVELVSQRLADPTDDETETILRIPGYRQTKSYTCGFSSGLMIVHAFRPRASIANFYYACNPSEESGTSTGKLVRALRKFGIGVSIRKRMTFEAIAAAIEDGTPVATTIKKGKDHHWLVAYGISRERRSIFIAGNGLPWLPLRTDMLWSDYRKLIPSDVDWLVCWGK